MRWCVCVCACVCGWVLKEAVCVRVLLCIRSGGIFVYLYMYVARQCMRVIVNLFYTRAYIRNCAADACLLQRMRVFVCVQRPEWKTTKE